MKRIVALVLAMVMIVSFSLTVFAEKSPELKDTIVEVIFEYTDDKGESHTIKVSTQEDIERYLDLILQTEAKPESELENWTEKMTESDAVENYMGDDYKNYELVTLFTFEMGEFLSDGTIRTFDEIKDDGTPVTSSNFVDVPFTNLKCNISIETRNISSIDELQLLAFNGVDWIPVNITAIGDGYITITLDNILMAQNIFGLLMLKRPTSPNTGDINYIPAIIMVSSMFGLASIATVKKMRIKD